MAPPTNHYTNLGFNEPDFPEYDSTPYGGGYDIASTYGKPLPPSTKICYPKDTSNSAPTPHVEELVQENGFTPPPKSPNGRDFDTPIEANPRQNNVTEEEEYIYDDDYDYGVTLPQENGNGYYGSHVPLPPSDYVEPCASFFGYWPCLLKDYQKNAAAQQCCSQQAYEDEWKKTEEYFFGSSYSYGERRDDGVAQCGYNKRYIEESSYVQEVYNPKMLSSEVSFEYGYETQYMEPPSYVQEESKKLSYDNGYERNYFDHPSRDDGVAQYGYNKHYIEQPSYVQEEYNPKVLSSQVNFNYGYERQYMELPSYVQEDCKQLCYDNGYERNYFDHPSYVQDDLPVQYQDLSSQVDYNYRYEKHYVEQSSYVQDDYSPQTWSQRLGYAYCDSYEES